MPSPDPTAAPVDTAKLREAIADRGKHLHLPSVLTPAGLTALLDRLDAAERERDEANSNLGFLRQNYKALEADHRELVRAHEAYRG